MVQMGYCLVQQGHACPCTAPPHQVVLHSHPTGLLSEQAGHPQRPLLVIVQTCKQCIQHHALSEIL